MCIVTNRLALCVEVFDLVVELGAQLRKAREDRGISLVEAEQATRIRRVFLQAIEEGRFGDLPGQVYGRGFIRNYARYLGLDPEALLQEYGRLAARDLVYEPNMLDEPLAPLSHRLFRRLLVVLLLAAVGVGLWYAYSMLWVGQGWRVRSLWPPVIGAPIEPTQEVPVLGDALPTALPLVAVTPGVTPTTAAAPELVATPTATPTRLPTPTPTPTATPTPFVGVHIEAIARADTWLEVRGDGALLWVGILRATETATWSANELMQLRVGNAGGLELLVNGRDVGPLGASGQVLTVEYRADQLP